MEWQSSKWCHPDSPCLKKLHQVSNRVKVMLIIITLVSSSTIVFKGCTVNAEYY